MTSLPVLVASHERSGTHFLMNTLALNFGFDARHFVSNDITSGTDFYDRDSLRRYLEGVSRSAGNRIVKEHHDLGFYDGLLDWLGEKFVVFYVYRNPADTLCSFWRYVQGAKRREGPALQSASAFLRAQPAEGMLRYQSQQHATILDRWEAHVDAWTGPAAAAAGIVALSYEALSQDFAGTVERVARRLGVPCPAPRRPSPTDNVILPGPGRIGAFRDLLVPEDIAHIVAETRPLLARLGWAELDRIGLPGRSIAE